LELNTAHQLLVCADVNLLGEHVAILTEGTLAVLDANKETGLAINREKMKNSTNELSLVFIC
jgi:hypothetical protein